MEEKMSKSFKLYLIIFIILIITFINPSTRSSLLGVFDSFGGVEKELELLSEFAIDKGIRGFDIKDERIIKWEDNSLSFLDFNGFEVLKKDFTFKEPDILIGEENLYVMDKSSGDIYLLDKKGDTLERINLKTPFYKLQEKEEDIFIYKKIDDEESIDIVDKKGEVLRTHKENIPILTVASKGKNKEYFISTLDINKGIKSIASIYSDSDELIHTLDIKDEIIIYSEFIKNGLLVTTEKGLYFIEKDQIKWEKKYDNLKDFKLIDNEIFLLYKNKFEIIDLRGKVKKEITLSKPLDSIIVTEDDIFIFGENDIIIPKKNKNILNFKTDEEILDLKYDDGKLLLQKEGKIEIYKIKEKGDN